MYDCDIVTLSPPSRAALLDAARSSLLQRLQHPVENEPPLPTGCEDLIKPSGCFVSLHERQTHRLRGCVGRLDPQQSLWSAVCHTACDVLRDPRFIEQPVTLAETPALEIEISILSPPRQAASTLDFDLLNDGIYLICSDRSGFFLPQVARETGWSKEQLLARLCTEKLNLPPDAWRSPNARLFTFQVEILGPVPLGDDLPLR